MNKNFYLLCGGQFLTQLGATVTSFGVAMWMVNNTANNLDYALHIVFLTLPGVLLAPFCGKWVERLSGKAVLMTCDTATAVCTFIMLLLLQADGLTPGWVYFLGCFYSVVTVLKYSTMSVTVTRMVPDAFLSRANGVLALTVGIVHLMAPALAGALYLKFGLQSLIYIDLTVFAIGFAAMVPVAGSKRAAAAAVGSAGNFRPLLLWIASRPECLLLFGYLLTGKFVAATVTVMVNPLLIAMYDEQILGSVLMTAALGAIAGSVVMSLWRVRNFFLCILVFNGFVGLTVIVLGAATSLPVILTFSFILLFASTVAITCERTFWQTAAPADLQGRFFTVATAAATGIVPLAAVISAALADHIFEPRMASDGEWAAFLGPLIGAGAGRGIGLMFTIFGVFYLCVTLLFMASRRPAFNKRKQNQYINNKVTL
jgi:DHA3 family macrolide efflux protein-like MFS transporter